MGKRIQQLLLVAALIVFILGWVFRPLFHPLVISLVSSPLKVIFVVLLLGLISFFIRQVSRNSYIVGNNVRVDWERIGPGRIILLVGLLIITNVGLAFESEIRFYLTSRSIEFTERDGLPTFTDLRLTPKGVANRYAQDSFQNPQEKLGDSQITLVNGELQRVFPRLPEDGLLYYLNKLNGFVTVQVDTLDRKVSIEDQTFTYAEGIGFFDNLYYQLPLKKYFVRYSPEPIYLKDDQNSWIAVVPYITYQGFPFPVPVWGGVMEVKPDGTIIDHSPEEAQQVSYFKGNRIYPKELSEYYAHSYAYKNGLINKWFLHKDETEVVSLPSDEATIHVPTNEGYKQMIVAEPYGASYGIYKIFFFDATSGKPEIVSYGNQSQLTGPIAAVDYIRREFPTFDWSSFSLVEPRPIEINNDLHWLLSIVPNDSAGIASTVLLNTRTNEVLRAENQQEIDLIVKGETLPQESPSAPITNTNEAINQKIQEIQRQLDELKTLVKPTPVN